jgi:hypothetical protein
MRTVRFVSVLAVFLLRVPARGSEEIRLSNWQAAPYWMSAADTPTGEAEKRSPKNELTAPPRGLLAVPTPALAFTGIAPCRVADTRNGSFPAGYGPPFMPGGVPRNFTITGRCGIPSSAQAVSFNFTVVSPAGSGFLLVFPQGGVQPTVSTLNYTAGQVVANAAVVPLGATGAITAIPGVSGFDLLIDVNGYYAPQGAFSHLIAAGGVASNGSALGGFVNLGTWTSSRAGLGSYEIKFTGLNPGCTAPFPVTLLTALQSGFVSAPSVITNCGAGDTTIAVISQSTAGAAADGLFFFSVYGPFPAASPLVSAVDGRTPTTCTFIASTGVTTCE